MARLVTLAALRTSVLRRGGVENSVDLDTAVLTELVNEAIAELWDILKDKQDDRLVTSTTLATSIGVQTVNLPTDFYTLRLVTIPDSTLPSGTRRLRAVSLDVAHQFWKLYGKQYRYRLQDSKLFLYPTPQAVESLTLFYVPQAPLLANDLDTFDDINGYSELVIEMAWRRCLVRQDLLDAAAAMDREIERLTERIKTAADGRDSEPFSFDPRGAGYGEYGDGDGWWGW